MSSKHAFLDVREPQLARDRARKRQHLASKVAEECKHTLQLRGHSVQKRHATEAPIMFPVRPQLDRSRSPKMLSIHLINRDFGDRLLIIRAFWKKLLFFDRELLEHYMVLIYFAMC